MLTKSTKTVIKTIEVEVETFNIELTKDQLIELAALLGNCRSRVHGNSLYNRIYSTLHQSDTYLIEEVSAKFGSDFEGVPQLQYL